MNGLPILRYRDHLIIAAAVGAVVVAACGYAAVVLPLYIMLAAFLERTKRRQLVFTVCCGLSVACLAVARSQAPTVTASSLVASGCLVGMFASRLRNPGGVPQCNAWELNETTDLSVAPLTLAARAESSLFLGLLERLSASGGFTPEQLKLLEMEWNVSQETADSLGVNPDSVAVLGGSVGDYVIQGLLDRGGAGAVYIAQRVGDDEPIALKVLRNAKFNHRFQREMELVQRMAHPNVIIAYEVGRHLDMPYIAMEKLEGPDLHCYVRDNGPMEWEEAVGVVLQAARGLEHAHQRGLTHRDVKPGNLIWDGVGVVKVADLGLATLGEGSEDFETEQDFVAGTVDFMAPEQASGLGNAVPGSDIYSLGATWYFLLTGRSRVPGTRLSNKLIALMSNRLDDLPADAMPEQLMFVWSRMVEHSLEQRFQSMTEVVDALEEAYSEASVSDPSIQVMIVEDDENDLILTIEMLKRSNKSVDVVSVSDLEQALLASHREPAVDLVLLDLRLPDSAGVDTVKRMRESLPYTPLVVLTGQHDVAIGESCLAAGADEFVCKNDLNAHLMERLIFITHSRHRHRHEGH